MAQKKVLFLGDSFTVGTGLGAGLEQQAFPFQLANKLKKGGLDIAEPKMYAVDGDTTKHLLGGLNAKEPQSNPDHKGPAGVYDMVVLSIGINDLFRGHSHADYEHHFKELLERAIHFAGDDPSKVMVVSIPAWDASPSVDSKQGTDYRAQKYEEVRANMESIRVPISAIETHEGQMRINPSMQDLIAEAIERAKRYNSPEGIAECIDEFNQAARTAVNEINQNNRGLKNIAFMDVTDLTRQQATLPSGKPDTSMFADDGIHYSGKMYEKWAERALQPAQSILLGRDVTRTSAANRSASA